MTVCRVENSFVSEIRLSKVWKPIFPKNAQNTAEVVSTQRCTTQAASYGSSRKGEHGAGGFRGELLRPLFFCKVEIIRSSLRKFRRYLNVLISLLLCISFLMVRIILIVEERMPLADTPTQRGETQQDAHLLQAYPASCSCFIMWRYTAC